MAPPYDRGALSNGFQLSINIGFILASFVRFGSQQTGTWSWRILIALAATPACIFTFGSYYLPETPNSLVHRRDRFHNVVGTLQRIRGTADVVEELNDMIVAAYIPNPPMNSFRMIAQRSYRPQLIMAIAIPFFRQAAGYNLIAFYAPILFQTINFGDNISLSPALMLGLVATSANIMSIAMVDRMGRRVLFIIGGVSMFVSHLAMGGAMVGRFEDDGVMSKGYAYLILALMCVYVIGFELSWGPLGWSVPSEIFPLQIRSTAQSLVVALSFLFTVFVAQVSLVLLCYLKSSIFFVFGGWVVVMTAFIYLFLPETMNVPIEQMDQVWRVHWFWRRIVGDEPVQEGHLDHV